MFNTVDTTASTNITWETVGFVIKKDIVGKYDDTRYGTYAVIWMSEGEKTENEHGGKTFVHFEFKLDRIRDKLKCKDGETIYLNGIFRVLKNGKPIDNKLYYQYLGTGGIASAQPWRNPNDFWDRFNIPVTYQAAKQPVNIEFRMADTNIKIADTIDLGEYSVGETIGIHSSFNVNMNGSKKTVKIPLAIEYGGKKYLIYRHYYYDNDKPSKKLDNTKISIYDKSYESEKTSLQDFDVEVKDGGSTIVIMYKSKEELSEDEKNTEYISQSLEVPEPTGVIGADNRGAELFSVEDGIPTTEDLYCNVFTNEFLTTYQFKRTFGVKYYTVKVSKNFILTWTTEDAKGKKKSESKEVPMTMSYEVEREYSYWEVTRLGVYCIDHAIVQNGALPNGQVSLSPNNYTMPEVVYEHSSKEDDHLIEPEYNDIDLGSTTINGGDSEPSIDDSYISGWDKKADKAVKDIKVKNDKLIMNGTIIMSDEEVKKETKEPIDMPDGSNLIGENVLYQSDLTIEATKANGEYSSNGKVRYKAIAYLNVKQGENLTYNIDDINGVVVHTPTVCDGYIENCDSINQMINPDQSRFSLILGTNFSLQLLTTGQHRYITGYEYRDYAKYISDRQVSLPFDVYNSSTYISANTWISMSDIVTFYIPTWVNEGKYTIQFRSISLNAYANDGYSKTQLLANTEIDNYIACDSIDVEVSGRIYGLNIYDISDYPMWENVFRKEQSLELTGFQYTVGTKNQDNNNNGNVEKYTIPLVNGSHPTYNNIGTLKTGYAVRFSLTTVGNMFGDQDYIRIRPTFYYVDYKGKNKQEVNVYYSETFLNKYHVMVKMGSDLDKTNVKALSLGKPYLSVSKEEIYNTSFVKKVEESDLLSKIKNVFTFSNIMIPENLRTFVGNKNSLPSNSLPTGISDEQLKQSIQKWYCEYYIPSEIHLVSKDFSITDYIKNNGAVDYKESFWLKNGYLVVNFDIETVQNNERHLSYINKENAKAGYCNMWKREGFQYKKKDSKNNEFDFIDGDFILYDINKSASKDYISSGTH